MAIHSCFIGFGEAARTFKNNVGWAGGARTFDIRTANPQTREALLSACARSGVEAFETCPEAVDGIEVILSLVTADQSLVAAEAAAPHIRPGALFLDMNSTAPQRKALTGKVIEQAGGRYVDVAIMAPVDPAGLGVPLLVSGTHAADGVKALQGLGFSRVRSVGDQVGQASTIKMVRSVLIKGIEALTAECLIAAETGGVRDEVLASLGPDWAERADYNLERMLVHGERRAAEMQEVCATLESLGIEPLLTRGTVLRQRALGATGQGHAPVGLTDKLDLICNPQKARAA